MTKAKIELHAAQSARARAANAAAAKADAERTAREAEERARLLAAVTPEERETQELLVRIAKADPHGHNAQSHELIAWRAELSKKLQRFAMLRTMEDVRDQEAARIAAQPPTRTFAMRFAAPTDFAIVMVDAVETHHRVIAGIGEDGSAERWRVPALCFESSDRIDIVRRVLEGEEARRRAMGLSPATFAHVLTTAEWRNPFVVARAAGVEPTHGRDVFCAQWLSIVSNDERVTAAWIEGRAGSFIDAIERAAIATANTRPAVGTLGEGRAFWKRLARNADPIEPSAATIEDAPDHDASDAAQAVTT